MSSAGAKLLTVEHDGSVSAIAFSPNSSLLASGGGGSSVALTPVGPGQELRIPSRGFVADLAFAPDGSRLALADLDEVAVHDLPGGSSLWRGPLQAQTSVNSVAYSPDGASLVATTDNRVFVIEAATGTVTKEIEIEPTIAAADLSADGRLLALAIDKRHGGNHVNAGAAVVIKLETGAELSRVTPGNAVFAIAFTREQRDPLVLFGSADHTTRMFNSTTGKEVWDEQLETGASSMAIDPTGRWVVVGSSDGAAIVLEAESGVPSDGRVSYNGAVTHVAFAGNGKWAASAGLGDTDDQLVVFNAESGAKRYSIPVPECMALRFSPDSRWLGLGHFSSAVIYDNGAP